MADDILLNAGSGGDTIGADDISGIKFQRVKLIHGADGTNDGDVSSANPLPVLTSPSAVSGCLTTSLLGASASYISPVIDIADYQQVCTRVVADQDGTVTIEFQSDVSTVVRTLVIPYVAADGFQLFSAPAFTPYVKYTFTNSGTPQAGPFYFETKLLQSGLSPQVLRLDAFVSPTMVSTVGRNVNMGFDPTSSSYKNVNVTEVVNNEGTTYSLNTVSSARPSQVQGRTPQKLTINTSADVLLHTVTASKTFYVTDIIVNLGNSDTGNACLVSLQDDTTATPASDVITFQAPEAPSGATSVANSHHTFQEPVAFTSGLFLDVQSGTPTMTGLIMGYEE